jgi:FixJ family two-component response regulator
MTGHSSASKTPTLPASTQGAPAPFPVFLVDDDADVRDALSLLLRTLGFRVEAFASAVDFLQRPASTLGCVVADIRMAGLSGIQLLEKLQADPWPLPVVIITGHGDMTLCRRAFKAGAVDFLTKPVDEHALLEAVQAGMSRLDAWSSARHEREGASHRLEQLSARESEIIALIADGLSTKEIARRLALSPRTVEKHRAGIALKVGTGSVADLVRLVMSAT